VAEIRSFREEDLEQVVALSLRAWEPVFDSTRMALGDEIFYRLYPRGVDEQGTAVANNIAQHARTTWVATGADGDQVIGFALVIIDGDSPVGAIDMIAVDPAHQQRGVGRALTDFATDRIRDAGKTVAMIGTGGDPGHGPARLTYASAGYTLMPMARFWKAL
jgi:ribosomal protein S18 acetylase RimI-like enzyme